MKVWVAEYVLASLCLEETCAGRTYVSGTNTKASGQNWPARASKGGSN